MRIGVVKESDQETRVAIVPSSLRKLTKAGFEVVVESGAGLASSHDDQAYIDAGASIGNRDEVLACPHVLAALQHHRPNSELNALQRGVQPRRPCPHHNQAWRAFRELGPRPSWRRFFFSPIDQQLGLHGPTSRVPTLAQNAGLVLRVQRRFPLLAQLTVDRGTQRLGIANVFWQHTDLDL